MNKGRRLPSTKRRTTIFTGTIMKDNFLTKEEIIGVVLRFESTGLSINTKCNNRNIPMDKDCIECPCNIIYCMQGRIENPRLPFINLYQIHQRYEDTIKGCK
jgi:hypothetical protein